MAGTAPRLPEQFRSAPEGDDDFVVSELVANAAGADSPYGDLEFPLPIEELTYRHPKPENMPHLAGGH